MAAMQEHVKVTPAGWWHVRALWRLIRESRRGGAANGALVWAPRWSPPLGLLQSVLAPPLPGVSSPRSLIAEQGGSVVGLGQMRCGDEPGQWDVVYLAVAAHGETRSGGRAGVSADRSPQRLTHRRATRLLGELCDAAMEVGAESVHARVSDEAERVHLFEQVGFSPVVREYTYYRPFSDDATTKTKSSVPALLPGMRAQTQADAYGVFQLYQRITPKVIQLAEAKRSQSWDMPSAGWAAAGWGRRFGRQTRVKRWVVEQDTRKLAWLQLTIRQRGQHTMSLMVDSSAGDLHQPLIAFALAALSAQPAASVVSRVREHHHGLVGTLEANGFYLAEVHFLMVKQLAARVHQPQFARALEKVV